MDNKIIECIIVTKRELYVSLIHSGNAFLNRNLNQATTRFPLHWIGPGWLGIDYLLS